MFNFGRLKQWLGYENINNTDLNAEFNNILSKAGSDTLSSANSTNNSTPTVTSMQATNNPGSVGSENLSQTTQQDIQQIRFQLNSIIGGSQWYSAPPSNITLINSALNGIGSVSSSRIVSGLSDANSQPMFLVPSGSTNAVTLKATATNFTAFFNNVSQTFTSDIVLTGLTVAPSSNNTATVNDASLSAQQSSKTIGERDTQLTLSSIGSNITALNGTWAAFKVVHSAVTEYFMGLVDTTNNRIRYCYRGFFFNSSSVTIPRLAISNADTVTLMKLSWIFATYNSGTAAVDVTYNNPIISGIAPSSPAIGDYWYDLTANTWKKYNGSSFVSQIAVLTGICIQDTSNTVAARSFDFYNLYNDLNSVELEWNSASIIRSIKSGPKVSIYGSTYAFDYNNVSWNTSSNMDSGETISTNTFFYLYLANNSKQYISSVAPHQRKFDLRGDYHPSKPWRCLGEVLTDGSSNFIAGSVNIAPYHQRVLPTGFNTGVKAKTAAYSITTDDPLIYANNSGGAFALTLPPASAAPKYISRILKTNSDLTALTVTPFGSDTISYAGASLSSFAMYTQEEYMELASDGTSVWNILNRKNVTNWASYTPTFTGFGTVSNVSAFWRRVGDTAEITFTVKAGTPSAAAATLTLPGGFSIDTTKIQGTQLGCLGFYNNTQGASQNTFVGSSAGVLFYSSVSGATVATFSESNSGEATSVTYLVSIGSDISNTNSVISGRFSVPISVWRA